MADEVAARWSADRVSGLAPDPASAKAARGLAVPQKWSGAGMSGRALWGACRGSGRTPYRTAVEPAGPAFRCSCPSRKIPCKHALGLLLLWSAGRLPAAEEPEWVRDWMSERAARAVRAPRAEGPKDLEAAEKRARERLARVTAGAAELRDWLTDRVAAGLVGLEHTPEELSAVAARMIDAQAPGLAGGLHRAAALVGRGRDWPERLLAELSLLYLLADAVTRLDELPAPLAATVRSRLGFPVSTAQVRESGERVADQWLITGAADEEQDTLRTRRTWLRGRHTGRDALVLSFAPPGRPLDNTLPPGYETTGELAFHPGAVPLRAVFTHRESTTPAPPPHATDAPHGTPGEAPHTNDGRRTRPTAAVGFDADAPSDAARLNADDLTDAAGLNADSPPTGRDTDNPPTDAVHLDVDNLTDAAGLNANDPSAEAGGTPRPDAREDSVTEVDRPSAPDNPPASAAHRSPLETRGGAYAGGRDLSNNTDDVPSSDAPISENDDPPVPGSTPEDGTARPSHPDVDLTDRSHDAAPPQTPATASHHSTSAEPPTASAPHAPTPPEPPTSAAHHGTPPQPPTTCPPDHPAFPEPLTTAQHHPTPSQPPTASAPHDPAPPEPPTTTPHAPTSPQPPTASATHDPAPPEPPTSTPHVPTSSQPPTASAPHDPAPPEPPAITPHHPTPSQPPTASPPHDRPHPATPPLRPVAGASASSVPPRPHAAGPEAAQALPGVSPAVAGKAASAGDVSPDGGAVAGVLAAHAGALAADPWLDRWPVVLCGVVPARHPGGWALSDVDGQALPLSPAVDPWPLLAVAAEGPVTVSGEWTDAGLRPLTCWYRGGMVRL
ncbi:SWIM zinc finger family protein [Amycolatopsis jiangsuensis]|uniref:SWIM-type domain-containing protein n=1 Tax=Amycolatopsis jiangsuensis TaxID=1181879 RepID=A0A840INC8_9PSEU|nr:SWIM zinc finger family protein [Amycolatopsis jiangsuensis]MBB4683059.1 hypothetical protein [Amycolatopsis jiangsuensis]